MVAIPTTTTLTLEESKRMVALEKVIYEGKQTFIAVGTALAEIRDSKLYRIDSPTFEAYCKKKWGWTKQHAYRLIECAPIAKSNLQVTSLNQAREVAKIPESKRAEVIEVASAKAESESRPMTARDIREAAEPPADPPVKSADAQLVEALGVEIQPANYFAVMADEQVAEMIERCSPAQIGPMILALQALTMKAVARKKQLLVAA